MHRPVGNPPLQGRSNPRSVVATPPVGNPPRQGALTGTVRGSKTIPQSLSSNPGPSPSSDPSPFPLPSPLSRHSGGELREQGEDEWAGIEGEGRRQTTRHLPIGSRMSDSVSAVYEPPEPAVRAAKGFHALPWLPYLFQRLRGRRA
jgi:hypothetical protein